MAYSSNAPMPGDGDAKDEGEAEREMESVAAGHQRSLFECIRPLVRYVDKERAVIETRVRTRRPFVCEQRLEVCVDAVLTITDRHGFEDEIITKVQTHSGRAFARFELVWPKRWWPASMGEQALYTLRIRLEVEGVVLEEQQAEIGLTSVRADHSNNHQPLLVNSQPFAFRSIVHVDHVDQSGLLPAGADALLVVRDHYGPDVFFDATDRAGILTLQCVPLDPDAAPGNRVLDEVERLAAHPSLMGYFVGHQGPMADGLVNTIRKADPTRPVYRQMPVAS